MPLQRELKSAQYFNFSIFQYFNLYILATQDEGAGFGWEDGEGDGGDGDRAVGTVCGGICGESCVDSFAWI